MEKLLHMSSQWLAMVFGLCLLVLLLPVAGQAADKKFDHDNTGFILNGEHQRLACDSCHVRGIFKGIPRTCESCHATVSQIGGTKKPANHMPTSNRCDDCHLETAFKPAQVDHNSVMGSCKNCHTPEARIATSKPSNHVPSDNNCENCHRTSTWHTRFDHAQAVGQTCASCHDRVKPATHTQAFTGGRDCGACHNTVAWSSSVGRPDHTTITNCVSCHVSGGRARNFKQTPPHIRSSDMCESCHNRTAASWRPVLRVDHNEVRDTCTNCHDARKPATHTPTFINGRDCGACHNTTTWVTSAKPADHDTRTSGCSTCHGVSATGKNPLTHIPTNSPCETCHRPTAWRPATFNHTMTTATCITCHNNTIRPGLSTATHMPVITNSDCSSCHNTAAWRPATRVDHNQISATCFTCHDGSGRFARTSKLTDPTPPHPSTSNVCSDCHNTSTWETSAKPADHNTRVSGCATCHGVTAVGKNPATHIPTNSPCETCHRPTAWRPTTFSHSMTTLACTSCHNSTIRPVSMTGHMPIISSPDCGACHNTGTAGSGWTSIRRVDHTQIPATTSCVTCHVSGGRATTFKSATHPLTSNSCASCHGVTAWTPATRVDHAQITGTCTSCHDAGMRYARKPTNHFPTTRNCGDCHNTTSWGPGTQFDHAGVATGTCNSCHTSTYIGVPPKNSGHFVTSVQCDQCHHITTAWRPTSYTHVSATYPTGANTHTGQNCQSCHTTNTQSVTYNGYNNGLPGTCGSCHRPRYQPGDHRNVPVSTNADCGRSGCHSYSRGW